MKIETQNLLATAKKRLGEISTNQFLLSFLIAAVLALISLNVDLHRAEAYFYDFRMRWKGAEAAHPDIALVSLGESEEDGSQNIGLHATLLEKILAQKPRAVIYFNRFDSSEVESNPAQAEEFVKIAQSGIAAGTTIILGSDVDLSGEVLPPYPLSLLPHAPSILHKDGTMFGEDKVMRRALLSAYDRPTIHLLATHPKASSENIHAFMKEIRGAYFYEPASSWHTLIRYAGSTNLESSVFSKFTFSQLLGESALPDFSGKYVLVESLRKDAMNDYGSTPFSRTVYSNPRLYVHASTIDTLLKNSGLIQASKWLDASLTFILALSMALVAVALKPSRGVLALFMFSSLLLVASMLLFRMGFWLPLVHPLFAMFFTYYLIVPYRAILEYKKRWEVQEKHDLLVKVEELKGNFLSLMSHDLKTPVAQIQGLAEMLLRQGNLNEEQKTHLQSIASSTENLDKFISKILNLTKVESNEIKIQKRSKDINKILEGCVSKLNFQAKQKNISLNLQLEPLFPIKVDVALLTQVFTNIIDNAIKYSPQGSGVSVRSNEMNGMVEVVVEDQGAGLDEEELDQLFTKFFRGKSHPGDLSKGSGLGLYLSKYFLGLHGGDIKVESKKGSGSKFVVTLPVEG